MIGRPPPRALVLCLGLSAVVIAAAAAAAPRTAGALIVNETRSVPKGLYRRLDDAEPEVGRLVAVRQPASARAYLSALGAPAGAPLLKRVAAAAGDQVCRAGDHLETPGRSTVVLFQDRRGTPLPQWRGCRRLGEGELFLLGDSRTSFDGRYFGPVRRTDLLGVYERVPPW